MDSSEVVVENQRKNAENNFNVLWNNVISLRSHDVLKEFSANIIRTLIRDEFSQRCAASKINELLQKKVSRTLGFELLNECLPHFSNEVINSCASGWINCCLNCHDSDKDQYLTVLTNIIKNSQNNPQFNKIFVAEFLSPTLSSTMKQPNNLNIDQSQMDCLIMCLKFFSSSCNAHKTKIDGYILKYLSSTSDKLVHSAGVAYFYAQHIGNAGKEGDNHKDSLTLVIRRLSATCHKLYNLILEDQVEFDNFNLNQMIEPFDVDLELPMDQQNIQDLNNLQHKTQILKNTLTWLGIFLGKNTFKTVHPKELLDVIRRGTSVHICLEKNSSSLDTVFFAESLIDIQSCCLKLLGILINQMKSLLAPFHYSTTKVITDMITRGQTCNCYRKVKSLQQRILVVLLDWLKTGMCKLNNDFHEKLISSLMLDAFPKIEKIECKNAPASKLELCSNALIILYILLDNTYLQLSSKLANALLSSLIETILSIQNGVPALPYDDECELFLYKIICCVIEKDPIKTMLPMSTVLRILQEGCKHENPNISTVCHSHLNIMEKICQPVFSSLDIVEEQSSVTTNMEIG